MSATTLVSSLQTPLEKILPSHEKLIVIDAKEPLPVAFHILSKHNIYSAPVFDSQKNEFCGFLDMVDVVAFIVGMFEDLHEKKTGQKKSGPLTTDFYTLLEQVCKFDQVYASSVADLSKRNPMCPLKPSDTIEHALRIFSKTGTHRIPIIHNGKLVNILSQSTVVGWLAKHVDLYSDLGKKTVGDLALGLKDVVTVKSDDLALEGFRLMTKHRINAVAVLESDGTLMTTLSAKDIKVLDDDALFTKLYKSTVEYVGAARSHELDTTAPAMSCHSATTYKDVVLKLGASRRHRVWIVDDKKRLLGVISLKDVITALLNDLDKEERILK